MTERERQDATVQALREALHPHWRDTTERAVRERLAQIDNTQQQLVRAPRRPCRQHQRRISAGRMA